MQESHLVSGSFHRRQLPSTWLKSVIVSGLRSGARFCTWLYDTETVGVFFPLLWGHQNTRLHSGSVLTWPKVSCWFACLRSSTETLLRLFFFFWCNIIESQFALYLSLRWGIQSLTGSLRYCIYSYTQMPIKLELNIYVLVKWMWQCVLKQNDSNVVGNSVWNTKAKYKHILMQFACK